MISQRANWIFKLSRLLFIIPGYHGDNEQYVINDNFSMYLICSDIYELWSSKY